MDEHMLRSTLYALVQANIDDDHEEYKKLLEQVPESSKEALLHLALGLPAAMARGGGGRRLSIAETLSELMYLEVEDPDPEIPSD
jgi:hypothetical protein